MKQKTEWGTTFISTTLERWTLSFCPEEAYFYNGTDLQWVDFYSRRVANTLGQRAGRIIGDE